MFLCVILDHFVKRPGLDRLVQASVKRLWLMQHTFIALCSSSNLQRVSWRTITPPPLPPPPPPPRPLPFDDNRVERLDPKSCPPLGRKTPPSYRIWRTRPTCLANTCRLSLSLSLSLSCCNNPIILANRLLWLLLLECDKFIIILTTLIVLKYYNNLIKQSHLLRTH